MTSKEKLYLEDAGGEHMMYVKRLLKVTERQHMVE
jgi:hypothetical protein